MTTLEQGSDQPASALVRPALPWAVVATGAWLCASSAVWAWGLGVRGLLPAVLQPLLELSFFAHAVRLLLGVTAVALSVQLVVRLLRPVGRRWRRGGAVVATGIALLALGQLLDPPHYGPRATFVALEHGLHDVARAHEQLQRDEQNGRADLPRRLQHLSVTSSVALAGPAIFVPRWSGIPDDAGGYWYSPDGSPQGYDMSGMICESPTRMAGDWWACGLAP